MPRCWVFCSDAPLLGFFVRVAGGKPIAVNALLGRIFCCGGGASLLSSSIFVGVRVVNVLSVDYMHLGCPRRWLMRRLLRFGDPRRL